MVGIAAFSAREEKLFRQRPILASLAGGAAVLALTLSGLEPGGWWIAVALLAIPVAFIASAGLAASEHASNLDRFDPALNNEDRQAVLAIRRSKGIARNAFLFMCLVMLVTNRLGSNPFLVVVLAIGALSCALYARRLFVREVAIVRTVADLPL